MQSVVAGQAPITLERKFTSGRTQIKRKIRHAITETNRIPLTKIKRCAGCRRVERPHTYFRTFLFNFCFNPASIWCWLFPLVCCCCSHINSSLQCSPWSQDRHTRILVALSLVVWAFLPPPRHIFNHGVELEVFQVHEA